jgi:hypothetical protein
MTKKTEKHVSKNSKKCKLRKKYTRKNTSLVVMKGGNSIHSAGIIITQILEAFSKALSLPLSFFQNMFQKNQESNEKLVPKTTNEKKKKPNKYN